MTAGSVGDVIAGVTAFAMDGTGMGTAAPIAAVAGAATDTAVTIPAMLPIPEAGTNDCCCGG